MVQAVNVYLQVARTALRTKLHEKLADHVSECIVDAVMAISKDSKPIDLHMVEIMNMQVRRDINISIAYVTPPTASHRYGYDAREGFGARSRCTTSRHAETRQERLHHDAQRVSGVREDVSYSAFVPFVHDSFLQRSELRLLLQVG